MLTQFLPSSKGITTRDGNGEEHIAAKEDGPGPMPHIVKLRSVFQCEAAAADPALHEDPEMRQCRNPTFAFGNESAIENFGLTTNRGECPVCKAISDAVEKAKEKTTIVCESMILAQEISLTS